MNEHSFRMTKADMILDSALDLLESRGFGATPVPLVAEQAGVATGTIYRYFPGKTGVVNARYRRWKSALASALLDGLDATAGTACAARRAPPGAPPRWPTWCAPTCRPLLTSSVAAVLYGRDRDSVFTEADWSNVDDRRIGAYETSKTVAERAAWAYMGELGTSSSLSLVTVNPGQVLGPLLSSDLGTSGEAVKKPPLHPRNMTLRPGILAGMRCAISAHPVELVDHLDGNE
jgi:AcrR family transcriptional regulator